MQHNIRVRFERESDNPLTGGDVPDWRIQFAARVASVENPAPGDARPGDLITLLTRTSVPGVGEVSFVTPGWSSLPLSLAIKTALFADRKRARVRFKGNFSSPTSDELKQLYDFFEAAMASAVFSYIALEAHANQLITMHLREGTHTVQRGKGKKAIRKRLSAAQIERQVSTTEKYAAIIPELTGIATPKGLAIWEDLKALKDLRDGATHHKSEQHYVRGKPDRRSLYYRLLEEPAVGYPQRAIRVMRHFAPDGSNGLDAAETELSRSYRLPLSARFREALRVLLGRTEGTIVE